MKPSTSYETEVFHHLFKLKLKKIPTLAYAFMRKHKAISYIDLKSNNGIWPGSPGLVWPSPRYLCQHYPSPQETLVPAGRSSADSV